jgi:hypothetical protein
MLETGLMNVGFSPEGLTSFIIWNEKFESLQFESLQSESLQFESLQFES